MFEVIFYKKEDGSVPVEEFLDSLDVKMRNKATSHGIFKVYILQCFVLTIYQKRNIL